MITVFDDTTSLAQAAAVHAIVTLQAAIRAHGEAIWVLAGGTTPAHAYQILADIYLDALDWSKVTFVIGDERIAPLDSPDSNWHTIDQILLCRIPDATFLRPHSDQSAEIGAGEYIEQLSRLPRQNNLPRFDLVWLGVGEDGHTLSLFPHHPSLEPTDALVIPIHDSPKPPADRLSLTLRALRSAQTTVILAAGDNKASIVKQALQPDSQLPIAQAAQLTHAAWYLDAAAAHLVV